MEYLDLNGGKPLWYLRLVNEQHPMEKDVAVPLAWVGEHRVDARMLPALTALLNAGKAYGIGVESAYRSFERQAELYARKVAHYAKCYPLSEARERAARVVKPPGCSEHHTGLAVDLYGCGDHSLTASFATTPAYRWLVAHAADFGFILRFPQGKEAVTGVMYEPWHFRYVGGAKIARFMRVSGLCLEEYLARPEG